jgi:hypothetical protein
MRTPLKGVCIFDGARERAQASCATRLRACFPSSLTVSLFGFFQLERGCPKQT